MQCVRQAEGLVFESQPQQTISVKTSSDNSTAKRLATGVSVTGPRKWPLLTDVPCHSRFGTLKNPHCSMAMRASIGKNLQPLTGIGDMSRISAPAAHKRANIPGFRRKGRQGNLQIFITYHYLIVTAVTPLECCRYGVKHMAINQS